jgi:hypothetical protein
MDLGRVISNLALLGQNANLHKSETLNLCSVRAPHMFFMFYSLLPKKWEDAAEAAYRFF